MNPAARNIDEMKVRHTMHVFKRMRAEPVHRYVLQLALPAMVQSRKRVIGDLAAQAKNPEGLKL